MCVFETFPKYFFTMLRNESDDVAHMYNEIHFGYFVVHIYQY